MYASGVRAKLISEWIGHIPLHLGCALVMLSWLGKYFGITMRSEVELCDCSCLNLCVSTLLVAEITVWW